MAKIRALRRCALFSKLSYRDLGVLASFMGEEIVDAGAVVAEEGQVSAGLIIISTGRLAVSLGEVSSAVIEIGSGEFLGELSLISQRDVRAVAAKALEPTTLLQLTAEGYQKLQTLAPETANRLSEGLLLTLREKMTLASEMIKGLVKRPV